MSASSRFQLLGLLCMVLVSTYASPQSTSREISPATGKKGTSSAEKKAPSESDSATASDKEAGRGMTPGHKKMLAVLKDIVNRTPDENL